MSWNFRHGGSWNSVTPKKRESGQWVDLLGGGGSGGVTDEKLLTGDPPTRSTTVSVQNDYGGDLQTALDSIGSDTRLTLDGATYTGTWTIPMTDQITIDGGGNSTLQYSGSADYIVNTPRGDEWATSIDATQAYSEGQEWLGVTDESAFSVGDVIRVHDANDPYRGTGVHRTDSGTSDGIGEFNEVTEVGSGEIRVDRPLIQNYPNSSGTLEVNPVDFARTDLRITGLTADGQDASSCRGLGRCYRVNELWVDNCTIQNTTGHSRGDGIVAYTCYRVRFDQLELLDTGRYGTGMMNGTTHGLVTDCTATRTGRYAYQFGSGGRWLPMYNAEVHNCHAQNPRQFVTDVHDGGENVRCYNITGSDVSPHKSRGKDILVENYETTGSGDMDFIRSTQWPENVTFRQIWMHGSGNWDKFGYQYHDKWDGDFPLRNALFEDIWWDDPDGDLTPFRFRTDHGPGEIDGLDIINCAHGDNWIDQQYFDNTTSWASSRSDWNVSGLNIQTPNTGQTPAEYFSEQHGWS